MSVEKPIDLKPGETTLEVTMRPAPKLAGVVLDVDGKPVASARVSAMESDQEISLDLTDEEGKFELELHYTGTFLIRAEEQRSGVAELTTQVPGPPVSLRLAPRGVLEVEVFDADGQPLPNDVMVRSEKDQSVKWVDPEEGKPGRLAGLAPGAYVVEKTIPERLPLTQKVEIIEGKVTRVTLRADRGATVGGKVVDHLGKPVEGAMVSVVNRPEMVSSGPDGRFEWKGVAPGAVELFAMHPNGAESTHAKINAPATEVVLTIPEVARVTGRVVDEKGAPVHAFEANGESVKADDGRFDVPSPNHTLDVWVEGYAAVFLTTAEGDVGDVVMKKEPLIEGDVLDAEGKPVSGATVMGTTDVDACHHRREWPLQGHHHLGRSAGAGGHPRGDVRAHARAHRRGGAHRDAAGHRHLGAGGRPLGQGRAHHGHRHQPYQPAAHRAGHGRERALPARPAPGGLALLHPLQPGAAGDRRARRSHGRDPGRGGGRLRPVPALEQAHRRDLAADRRRWPPPTGRGTWWARPRARWRYRWRWRRWRSTRGDCPAAATPWPRRSRTWSPPSPWSSAAPPSESRSSPTWPRRNQRSRRRSLCRERRPRAT